MKETFCTRCNRKHKHILAPDPEDIIKKLAKEILDDVDKEILNTLLKTKEGKN